MSQEHRTNNPKLQNEDTPVNNPPDMVKWIGPKPWAEVSTDEKLERLRTELDAWRRECGRLRARINLLEHHQHSFAGAVRVDLQQADHCARQEYSCASLNTLV